MSDSWHVVFSFFIQAEWFDDMNLSRCSLVLYLEI